MTITAVPVPNFTQAPNVFFDEYLLVMGEAEIKLIAVIIRRTFGYHIDTVKLSISKLQELTKLSRSAVIKAIESTTEKGIIKRVAVGRSYEYQMVVQDDYSDREQSSKTTIDSSQKLPKIVVQEDSSTHDLNKEKKDSKEKDSASAAKVSKEVRDEIFEAVCFGSWKIKYVRGQTKLSGKPRSLIGEAVSALLELEPLPTGKELADYYADYCERNPYLSPIQSPAKLALDLMAFRDRDKQAPVSPPNYVPPDTGPKQTPEERRASYERSKAKYLAEKQAKRDAWLKEHPELLEGQRVLEEKRNELLQRK